MAACTISGVGREASADASHWAVAASAGADNRANHALSKIAQSGLGMNRNWGSRIFAGGGFARRQGACADIRPVRERGTSADAVQIGSSPPAPTKRRPGPGARLADAAALRQDAFAANRRRGANALERTRWSGNAGRGRMQPKCAASALLGIAWHVELRVFRRTRIDRNRIAQTVEGTYPLGQHRAALQATCMQALFAGVVGRKYFEYGSGVGPALGLHCACALQGVRRNEDP